VRERGVGGELTRQRALALRCGAAAVQGAVSWFVSDGSLYSCTRVVCVTCAHVCVCACAHVRARVYVYADEHSPLRVCGCACACLLFVCVASLREAGSAAKWRRTSSEERVDKGWTYAEWRATIDVPHRCYARHCQ
jgi:hypothetical protein